MIASSSKLKVTLREAASIRSICGPVKNLTKNLVYLMSCCMTSSLKVSLEREEQGEGSDNFLIRR